MSKIDSKIRNAKRKLIIRTIKDLKWAILIGLTLVTISIGFIPVSSGIVTGVVVDSGYLNTEEGNLVYIIVNLANERQIKVSIPRKGAFKIGETVRLFENELLFFSRKRYKFINYDN